VKGKKFYFKSVDLEKTFDRGINRNNKMGNAQVSCWWIASVSRNVCVQQEQLLEQSMVTVTIILRYRLACIKA